MIRNYSEKFERKEDSITLTDDWIKQTVWKK